MAAYKLTRGSEIIRTADNTVIPADLANTDYRVFLEWDAQPGNTPDPADPAPVEYNTNKTIDARLRTTNATPTEIFRAPLAQLTVYIGRLTLIGIDAGNGNVRYFDAEIIAKRLGGGAVVTGTALPANISDAGASGWAVTATALGNDFVITVTGQAGRNIDWNLRGVVISYTPGGIS